MQYDLNDNIKNNLENTYFTNPLIRLTSPRSLEACKRRGVEPKELYFIDFPQYKNAHPELRFLSQDVQRGRWQQINKIRESTISQLIEERKKIIMDHENIMDPLIESHHHSQSLSKSKMKTTSSIALFKSKVLENDMKPLIKIKQKQNQELKSLLENELRKELIRRDNEVTFLGLKKKEEEHKKIFISKYKESQVEKQRQDEIKIIQGNEQQHKGFDKEEFRAMNEKYFIEQQQKAQERQKLFDEKERQRQQFLKAQRIEKQRLNEKKKEMQDKKIETIKVKKEEKLQETLEDFLQRQKRNEEKRRQYQEMKRKHFKQQQEESIKKQEEIRMIIDEKNKELEQMKRNEYNTKQQEIQLQKANMEKLKERQQFKEKEDQRTREKRLIEIRENNNQISNEKVNSIMQMINITNEKVEKLKENKERELMLKNESEELKKIEKNISIKRVEKMKEYETEKLKEKIHEDQLRAEEFRNNKIHMSSQIRDLTDEAVKKKSEIIDKCDLFIKKNLKFTPGFVKEIFPGDEKLYDKLIAFQSEMKTKKNTSIPNFSRIPTPRDITKETFNASSSDLRKQKDIHINMPPVSLNSKVIIKLKKNRNENLGKEDLKTNPISDSVKTSLAKDLKRVNSEKKFQVKKAVLTEADINKNVEEYRQKLIDEMLQVLTEEKYKEEERELLYNKTSNTIDKMRLEKIFSAERAQSSERVMKLNKMIDEKVLEYEVKMRKESKAY